MSCKQLIRAGESQTLEFKTSFDKSTIESLVTFAQAGAKQPEEAEAKGPKSSEKSSEKILALLRTSPDLTISDLAQQLGISKRAIEKQIENLKRNGNLRRVGPDKGGYWQVWEKSQ